VLQSAVRVFRNPARYSRLGDCAGVLGDAVGDPHVREAGWVRAPVGKQRRAGAKLAPQAGTWAPTPPRGDYEGDRGGRLNNVPTQWRVPPSRPHTLGPVD
jgi:hypothetical protein